METRYQRIAREQAERQAARQQVMRPKRRKVKPQYESDEPASPSLDPDGRWMDNLGESPGF